MEKKKMKQYGMTLMPAEENEWDDYKMNALKQPFMQAKPEASLNNNPVDNIMQMYYGPTQVQTKPTDPVEAILSTYNPQESKTPQLSKANMPAPIALSEPTWWDKTKSFLGTPLGGSLLTSGLVGGLTAAFGGSPLEALSYGAQGGGTASNIYQKQRQIENENQLRRDYYQGIREDKKLDHRLRYNLMLPNAKLKKGPEDRITNFGYPLKSYKDSERLAANFANRMIESSKILDEYEENGGNAFGAGEDSGGGAFAGKALGALVPDVIGGNNLERMFSSDKKNQYDSAAENWLSANLRKESGAAIPLSEIEQEKKKYFPQIGDSKETIDMKRRLRKEAEKGMIFQAGEAYSALTDNTPNSIHPTRDISQLPENLQSQKDPLGIR